MAKIEPFYESLFFCDNHIFLLILIRDLDNPFGYYEKSSREDAALKPLQDTEIRLTKIVMNEAVGPGRDAA